MDAESLIDECIRRRQRARTGKEQDEISRWFEEALDSRFRGPVFEIKVKAGVKTYPAPAGFKPTASFWDESRKG